MQFNLRKLQKFLRKGKKTELKIMRKNKIFQNSNLEEIRGNKRKKKKIGLGNGKKGTCKQKQNRTIKTYAGLPWWHSG